LFGPGAFPDDDDEYKVIVEQDIDAYSEHNYNDKTKLKMSKHKAIKMKSMQEQDFEIDDAPD